MLHTIAPTLDDLAGRFIAGVLNLSSYHPVLMVLILAALAGAVALAWADLISGGRAPTAVERPIRLWRR